MSDFQDLHTILSLSIVGRATNIRKLNPLQLHVFLMAFSMCFKGHSFRRFNAINRYGLVQQLRLIYGLDLSRRQIDRAMSKIVELGLLERTVSNFPKQLGTQKVFTKTSFYRIKTK